MNKELNRFISIKNIFIISVVLLTNHASASSKVIYKSIYNVNHGAVIYSHNSGVNQYIWADYAHNLSGDWRANANWAVSYNNDGTISFSNQNSQLCLQHYGTGYQVVEHTCTSVHSKQKFNFELIDTGAILIKFAHNNECIYMSSGIRYYSIYSDVCNRTDKSFYWAIIPPLEP
ncbi:hypothetical protein [Yersinia bercovieri]|uniref:hypothetical protein n=1 Tax=Yersinia bercovieri TaxID=634 RepID=UPI0005DBFCB3|nr:hypothetical protein [Yersinia bercovieri]MDN0103217.1 hypothetical protein [Yersinia bercovieri]CNJ09225.1 Cytolethal distending toxin A/C family [Yersinia bercovieri]